MMEIRYLPKINIRFATAVDIDNCLKKIRYNHDHCTHEHLFLSYHRNIITMDYSFILSSLGPFICYVNRSLIYGQIYVLPLCQGREKERNREREKEKKEPFSPWKYPTQKILVF